MSVSKIGLDIGGSFIKAGLIKGNKVVKKVSVKTEENKGKKVVIENIIKAIELVKDGKIKGIGIGCPGPADYEKGLVIDPPNLKSLHGVNLKKIIKNKFKVKVGMENDASCVALAESAKRKNKNFLVVTIGTGIGCGIIINRELYKGKGNASEAGYMIIDDEKYWEPLASGKSINLRSKKLLGKEMYTIDLVKLAKKGDRKAKKVIEESADYMGIGLANLVNVFDPEIIVLTGGLKESGNYYLDRAKKSMKKHAILECDIVWCSIKDVALIGASCLV